MTTIITQARRSGKAWASRKRIIYLSGPMTGLPEFNYPEFHRVTAKLRAMGHRVYNPAEYGEKVGTEKFADPAVVRAAFADYTRFICTEADTIVLLPGWKDSKGAAAEVALARVLGLDVIEWYISRRSPNTEYMMQITG